MDELRHLNENLKVKLDVSLSENDELQRKIEQYRRKEGDMKKLIDSL
jgi:hypothetical protein